MSLRKSDMEEINEEIKLTLNLMQTDIDYEAHSELQCHLASLLEIKRNELQQRLVERSWVEPADGMGSVVSFDQAPYKSVKLEGQIANEAKPLTADELSVGDWWCADVSEECRLALVDKGVYVVSPCWSEDKRAKYAYKSGYGLSVIRTSLRMEGLKQIHRIGNEFYWSGK